MTGHRARRRVQGTGRRPIIHSAPWLAQENNFWPCASQNTHQLGDIWFIVRTVCRKIAAKLCTANGWPRRSKGAGQIGQRVRHNQLPATVKAVRSFYTLTSGLLNANSLKHIWTLLHYLTDFRISLFCFPFFVAFVAVCSE